MNTSPKLHQSLFSLLLDPSLPSQHSYTILRMCMIPRMNYWSRVFSPTAFELCAKDFDRAVLDTFTKKLVLPPLGDVARDQLSLPVFLGGFGLRSMYFVSCVAWWCALAQYYYLISPLVPSHDCLLADSKVSFVISQYKCHRFLSEIKVKLPRPAPSRPEHFFTDFKSSPAVAGFQRKILAAIYADRVKSMISRLPRSSPDLARLNSLSDRHASAWLSTPPICPSFILPDQTFNISCRIRLGLPPYA